MNIRDMFEAERSAEKCFRSLCTPVHISLLPHFKRFAFSQTIIVVIFISQTNCLFFLSPSPSQHFPPSLATEMSHHHVRVDTQLHQFQAAILCVSIFAFCIASMLPSAGATVII